MEKADTAVNGFRVFHGLFRCLEQHAIKTHFGAVTSLCLGEPSALRNARFE